MNYSKLKIKQFVIRIGFSPVFILLFFCASLVSNAQPAKWKSKKYFTVMSYNVENLFDTIDDPKVDDHEFLPTAKKQYNSQKYNEKLAHLSEVISSINNTELPEIVGLVELENKGVLDALAATPLLRPAHYKSVLVEGPDPRGIECGLLYRPDAFKYLSHKAIIVRFPETHGRTRDILYVKGMVKKDTVHVFVNHWTSRRSGEDKSEFKRVDCATVLKHNVDSILTIDANANIIIMGDFNDEPSSESLYKTLDAGKLNEGSLLVNLMYNLHEQGKGTYYFRGKYDMLDNMVVTRKFLAKAKGFRPFTNHGFIYRPDFICYTQKNGDKTPNKSYGGNNYYGGYSDHFPIYGIFYEK